MKNNSIYALLLSFVSCYANAEATTEDYTSNLTTKKIDYLNGEQVYWDKLGSIEEARGNVIKLKVQNSNLEKAAGLETVRENDGVKIKVTQKQPESTEVATLRDFLKLSLKDETIIKGESSAEQEQIISDSSFHNMEIAGSVDSRGNPIGSVKEETKQDNQQLLELEKKMELETREQLMIQQGEFMSQLSVFLDNKLKEIQQAPNAQAETISEPQNFDEEYATPDQQVMNDVMTENVEQGYENGIDEPSFEFEEKSYSEEVYSPFHFPTGKIKKVTPSGVEVVLAYEWKDDGEDTAFASAVIEKGSKVVSFFPMVRFQHTYDVEEYSDSYIVLTDPLKRKIIITK